MAQPAHVQASKSVLTWCEPHIALASFLDAPGVLLLQGDTKACQGYSYLTAFPEFTVSEADPCKGFQSLKDQFRSGPCLAGQGFHGGYAGLLGYDFGQAFEKTPSLEHSLCDWPVISMGWYGAVLVFDHAKRHLDVRGEPKAAARLVDQLFSVESVKPITLFSSGSLNQVWDDQTYLDAVQRAKDYIRAGDVFQVNLSHAFHGVIQGRDGPATLMSCLAQSSPSNHSAYYALDSDHVLVTNSPERFIHLDNKGRVETRPIKGTSPRHNDPRLDVASKADLQKSDKDRAENLMIVDLMRNDLSRVCKKGSVQTPDLFALESLVNVHHLVSTIHGELDKDKTIFDLIDASFPPGSVTGAPKPRAMEIIAELEGVSRGPYCGAIGWIGMDGAADFNVMIRAAACIRQESDWQIEVRSGGAITIESDPHSELRETYAKLNALKSALESQH